MPVIGFSLVIAIALCFHAVRTRQETFWIWILLMLPGVGSLVYGVMILLPDLMGGSTARRLQTAAKQKLDPTRDYREAKEACDDSPTTGNRMRLAAAAFALERYAEAEGLYRDAASGIHSEDPALLMGRALSLVELKRYDEALVVLHALGETGEKGRTAQAAVAMGRAYEGLGRNTEADTAFEWAAPRLPGLEGIARYAAFLAATGRRDEAEQAMAEIERRTTKAKVHFRKEAKHWRDFAAAALAAHQ